MIASDEPRGDDVQIPSLTFYIDNGRPERRVTGISVHSNDPEGLTSASIPDIDLAAIVKVLASRFPPEEMHAQLTLFEDRAVARHISRPTSGGSDDRVNVTGRDESESIDTNPVALLPDSGKPIAGKAYRKMPDPNKLREDLSRIGSVTGLAKHYDVPRHTAQGWVGRLKKMDNSLA